MLAIEPSLHHFWRPCDIPPLGENLSQYQQEKATSQQIVCYYRIEKNDTRRLQPEDIDPNLCTHLIVGYTEVRYDFMLPKTIYDLDTFNRTVALKKKNAKMKIMLSIGEKSKGGFSHMVASSNGREKFIFSLLHFLDKYKFDGVDFDWEFPAWNGANPLERFYFILLLKELRFVIEQAKRNFLVSCAVAAHVAIIDTSYDIPEMANCQVIYSQFGLTVHQKNHQARRRFVEWAQNEIAVVPDFHKRILFSDEAHFWLNGYVNKQNCRIWSEANPQVYVETPLHLEKLTVWCALWAAGILLQKR
ncbi:acidic mammalian chitinase [Trichonephila clavipes]|nr:acidic mammalian chitinase [Trichonephila clavipes]